LDRLEVPNGYRADVLLTWGDRLGDGVMGFNNDYVGTPEKQFASPLECSRRTGLMAARNRGYRATSGSLISSREMSPGASQSSPARYQVQTQT
jgi:hypothetical protein